MVAVSRNTVIELLVDLFSRSRAKDLVGTDALRTVLSVRSRDVVRDGAVYLEPVWELLADQPGFETDTAAPPLCRLKQLETRLGMPVHLPAALADIDAGTVARRARELSGSDAAVERLLAGSTGPNPTSSGSARGKARDTGGRADRNKRPTLSEIVQEAVSSESGASAAPKRGARKKLEGKEGLVAIIAAVCILAGGFAVVRTLLGSRGEFQQVAADFGDIPVTRTQRLGNQMGAVLRDRAWLDLPRATREAQLATVLDKQRQNGIRVVFVMSPSREVFATASTEPGGDVRVELKR